jgi:hypothetical protein
LKELFADFKENVTISIESKVFCQRQNKMASQSLLVCTNSSSIAFFRPAFKKQAFLPIPDYKIIYRLISFFKKSKILASSITDNYRATLST